MTTKADDMVRLRETRGLSRARYERERRAIDYKHDAASAPARSDASDSRFVSNIPPDRDEKPAAKSRPSRSVPATLPSRATYMPLSGLTKRQELWTQHYAEHGDGKAAAWSAGYSPARADNRASENKHNEAVLNRVRELVQLRQSAGAPVAVGIIEQIAAGEFEDARKAAVQLKAAVVMSHTAGVGPVVRSQSETHSTVEHRVGVTKLAAAWDMLERAVGQSLSRPAAIIDITPNEGPTDA